MRGADNRGAAERHAQPQPAAAAVHAIPIQNPNLSNNLVKDILKEEGFRRALVGMYIWKICVLVYGAIVFASPWEAASLNYSATICVCSLVAWSTLLEILHILCILINRLYGRLVELLRWIKVNLGITTTRHGDLESPGSCCELAPRRL